MRWDDDIEDDVQNSDNALREVRSNTMHNSLERRLLEDPRHDLATKPLEAARRIGKVISDYGRLQIKEKTRQWCCFGVYSVANKESLSSIKTLAR